MRLFQVFFGNLLFAMATAPSLLATAVGSFFLQQPTLPPAGQVNMTAGGSFFRRQPTFPSTGQVLPVDSVDVPTGSTMPVDLGLDDLDPQMDTGATAVDFLDGHGVEMEILTHLLPTGRDDVWARIWELADYYTYSDLVTREEALTEMCRLGDSIGVQVELLRVPRVFRRIDDGYSVETERVVGFIDGAAITRTHVFRRTTYP